MRRLAQFVRLASRVRLCASRVPNACVCVCVCLRLRLSARVCLTSVVLSRVGRLASVVLSRVKGSECVRLSASCVCLRLASVCVCSRQGFRMRLSASVHVKGFECVCLRLASVCVCFASVCLSL